MDPVFYTDAYPYANCVTDGIAGTNKLGFGYASCDHKQYSVRHAEPDQVIFSLTDELHDRLVDALICHDGNSICYSRQFWFSFKYSVSTRNTLKYSDAICFQHM